jgi:hypothetical protein
MWRNNQYVERTNDTPATFSSGGLYTALNKTSRIEILVDDRVAWGMEVSDADADSLTMRHFSIDVSIKKLEEHAKVVDYKLLGTGYCSMCAPLSFDRILNSQRFGRTPIARQFVLQY